MAAPDSPGEVGKRLRRLRFAYGYESPDDWGEHVGVKRTTWLNWEAGTRLIPPGEAVRLSQQLGLTTDWIYRGFEHTLPLNVQQILNGIRSEDLPPPKRRSAGQ